MEKKYICMGARVLSKNDSDIHYISPHKLPNLYGVPNNECYFVSDPDPDAIYRYGLHHKHELIVLLPDYHGNYKINEELTLGRYLNLPEYQSTFPDEEWEPSWLSIVFWIIFAIMIIYMTTGIK